MSSMQPNVRPVARVATRFAKLTEFFFLTAENDEPGEVLVAFKRAAEETGLTAIRFEDAWNAWNAWKQSGDDCPFVFGHTVFVELDVLAASPEMEAWVNELMEVSHQGALIQFVPF